MRSKHFNIRAHDLEKKVVEDFISKHTDFDNVSDYARSLMKTDMRKHGIEWPKIPKRITKKGTK